MKKLFTFALISSSLLIGINEVKADTWDHWGLKMDGSAPLGSGIDVIPDGIKIYTINSATGNETFRNKICPNPSYDSGMGNWQCRTSGDHYVDQNTGNLIIHTGNGYEEYDLDTNTFSTVDAPFTSSFNKTFARPIGRLDQNGNKIVEISGSKIIEKKSDGSLHIGQNSAIFKEEDGREKFWAQDANGNKIPIDITNGSKLLINGRDVEQSINNVGALSAALTGLPTVPTDTNLACGLGTGTHGGDFAFSGGCASKVNEKLSLNYAASVTMPGQNYAGDFENKFSARAGFIWKLGKVTQPTQISMRETKELKQEISDLKNNNNQIISQNKNLQLENQSIISQNKALLARLERLEKVALGDLKSKDLAVYPLK